MASRFIDISGWQKKRKNVQKQVAFATAVALTRTAKDAQAATKQAIPRVFDRPIPFTQRAIGITSARKNRLFAEVFAKDRQAEYLAIQEEGGVRRPRPRKPINIPVNIRTNVYGNIPRRAIKREAAKPNVFTVGRRDRGDLPPGIYRRSRSRRRSGPPKLLVAFSRVARYRPRFGFKRRVERTVLKVFPRNFNDALRRALATAR